MPPILIVLYALQAYGLTELMHVRDLNGRHSRIEEAFLLGKRLVVLTYLWTGAANSTRIQVWATRLLSSALVDLSDAVAEELDQPLDRMSVEMVY